MGGTFCIYVDRQGNVRSRVSGSLVDQNNNAIKVATYLQKRSQFATKIADKFVGNLPFNDNPGEPLGITE